jgi:hypothetical protein
VDPEDLEDKEDREHQVEVAAQEEEDHPVVNQLPHLPHQPLLLQQLIHQTLSQPVISLLPLKEIENLPSNSSTSWKDTSCSTKLSPSTDPPSTKQHLPSLSSKGKMSADGPEI